MLKLTLGTLLALALCSAQTSDISTRCYVSQENPGVLIIVNDHPMEGEYLVALHAGTYLNGRFVANLVLDAWRPGEYLMRNPGGYRTYALQRHADECRVDAALYANFPMPGEPNLDPSGTVEGPDDWDIRAYHAESIRLGEETHFWLPKSKRAQIAHLEAIGAAKPHISVPPTIQGWNTSGYVNGVLDGATDGAYICAETIRVTTGGSFQSVQCDGNGACSPQPNLYEPGKTEVSPVSLVGTICPGWDLSADGSLIYQTFQGNPNYEVGETYGVVETSTGLVGQTKGIDSCVAPYQYTPLQIGGSCGGGGIGGCDPPRGFCGGPPPNPCQPPQ